MHGAKSGLGRPPLTGVVGGDFAQLIAHAINEMICSHRGVDDNLVQVVVGDVHRGVEEARIGSATGDALGKQMRAASFLAGLEQMDHAARRIEQQSTAVLQP